MKKYINKIFRLAISLGVERRNCLIVFGFLLGIAQLQAQPVCYDYDDSGNRIARYDCNPIVPCPCITNGSYTIGSPENEEEVSILSQTDLYLANPNGLEGIPERVCISVYGTLVIDLPYNFKNVEFKMHAGSRINVVGGALTIERSHLHSCEIMWEGIDVAEYQSVFIGSETLIEDAYRAVTLHKEAGGDIRNTIFNKNEYGIYFDGGDDVSSINTGVDENTFKCDGPLLDHKTHANGPSSKTIYGIDARNATFQIGSLTPGYKNTFTGIFGAVRVFNCITSLNQIDVNNMEGTSYKSGTIPYPAYGYANDIGVLARYGGLLSILESTIKDVDRGVDIENMTSFLMYHSTITSDVVGVFGNKMEETGSFAVKNSTIKAKTIGIRLYNANGASVKIDEGNVIEVKNKPSRHSTESGYGILISNIGLGYSSPKVIRDNTITFDKSFEGIHLQNDYGYYIQDNLLTLNNFGTNNKPTRGIALENTPYNRIIQNTIVGDVLTLRTDNTTAVYNNNGQGNTFCCNSTNQMKSGFNYLGLSDNTEMKYNNIGSHGSGILGGLLGAGLYINSGTSISPQIDNWNKWTGFHSAIYKAAINLNQINNPALLANSAFEVSDDIGTIWYPNSVSPATDWFKSLPRKTAEDCSLTGGCQRFFTDENAIGLPLMGNDDINMLNSYITGRYSSETFGEYNTWSGRRWALREINRNPALLSNTTINTFKVDNQNSNIKNLNQIDDNISLFNTPNATQQTTLKEINETIKSSQTRLAELSTLITAHPNEVGYKEERNDLLKIQASMLRRLGELQRTIRNSTLSKISEAKVINSSLVPQNEFERNEKVINEIYLSTVLGDTLTDGNKQAITTIASLCPMIGGTAVFKARHLYGYFAVPGFDDEAICFPSGGSISGKIAKNTTSNPEVRIYPNPVNDELFVNTTSIEPVTMILFDITGKIVMQQDFTASTQISTSDLLSGLYFCEIWKGKEKLFTQKLSVVH